MDLNMQEALVPPPTVEPPLTRVADTPLSNNETDRVISSAAGSPNIERIQHFITLSDDWAPTKDQDEFNRKMAHGVGEAIGRPLYEVVEGAAGQYFTRELQTRFQKFYENTPGAKNLTPKQLSRVEKSLAIDLLLERRPLRRDEQVWLVRGAVDELVDNFATTLLAEAQSQDPAVAKEASSKLHVLRTTLAGISEGELYAASRYWQLQQRKDRYTNSVEQREITDVMFNHLEQDTQRTRKLLSSVLGNSEHALSFAVAERITARRNALKAKDVGILDHDPLKEGVWSESAGRYNPVLFAGQGTLDALAKGVEVRPGLDQEQQDEMSMAQVFKGFSQIAGQLQGAPEDTGLMTPARKKYLAANPVPILGMNINPVALKTFVDFTAAMSRSAGQFLEMTNEQTRQLPALVEAAQAVGTALGAKKEEIDNAVGVFGTASVVLNMSKIFASTHDYQAQVSFWDKFVKDNEKLSPAAKAAVAKSELGTISAIEKYFAPGNEENDAATARLAKYYKHGASDKYGWTDATSDAAHIGLRAAGQMFYSGIVQGIENPQMIPFALAGEAWVEPKIEAILGHPVVRLRALDNPIRLARYQNRMAKVAELLPSFVNKMRAEYRGALKQGLSEGDMKIADQKLTQLEARTQTLLDIHQQADVTPEMRRSEASLFGRAFREVMPYIDVAKLTNSEFETWMDFQADTDRGTFGWKNAREMYFAWKGKVPAGVTKQLNQAFSFLNKDFLERLRVAATDAEFEGSSLLKMKQDAARYAAEGNSAAFDDVMRKYTAVMGGPDKPGPGHKMLRDLMDIYKGVTETAAAKDPNERAVRQAAVNVKVKALLKGQLPDNLDMTQLRLLDEASGRPGKMFWDNMQRFVYKVSGKKLFSHAGSELHTRVSMARQLHDWFANNALSYYSEVMANSIRKLRMDHLYRFALNKLTDQKHLIDVEAKGLRAAGQDTKLLDADISKMDDFIGQVKRERRAVLATPVGQVHNIRDTLLTRYVSPDDVAALMSDQPTLWDGIEPDELSSNPRHNPTTKKILQELFEDRRSLRKEIKSVQGLYEQYKKLKLDVDQIEKDVPSVVKAREVSRNTQMFKNRLDNLQMILKKLDEFMRMGLSATKTEVPRIKPAGQMVPFIDPHVERRMMKNLVQARFYQEAAINEDQAQKWIMVEKFIDILPDQYLKNHLKFELETNPAAQSGHWSILEKSIAMLNEGDPQIFFHEWGHAFLDLALTDKEIKRLFSIFEEVYEGHRGDKGDKFIKNDTLTIKHNDGTTEEIETAHEMLNDQLGYAGSDPPRWPSGWPGLAEVMQRPHSDYMDQFTEWFARNMELYVTRRVTKNEGDPRSISLRVAFAKLMRKAQQTWEDFIAALRGIDLNPPMTQWFDDFFAGKIEVVNNPVSKNEAFNRRMWYHTMRDLQFTKRGMEMIKKQRAERNEIQVANTGYGETYPWREQYWDLMVELPMRQDVTREELKVYAKKVALEKRRVEFLIKSNEAIELFYKHPEYIKKADTSVEALRNNEEQIKQVLGGTLAAEKAGLRMEKLVNTKAMTKDLNEAFKKLQVTQKGILSYNYGFKTGVDPLTIGAMNFWQQSAMIKGIMKAAEYNTAVAADKLDRLAAFLDHVNPNEREDILKLIKAGTMLGPENVDKFSPQVRAVLDRVRSQPYGEATVANLMDWLRTESGLQAKLLETAVQSGFIDQGLYDAMRTRGYSPHLYGIYERPRLVQSGTMKKARRALKGSVGKGEGNTVSGVDGSELRFARDLNMWRVYARESDGTTHDYRFDTEGQALEYIARKWDDGIVQREIPESSTEVRKEYKALTGEVVSVAKPIGDEADILDLLTGHRVDVRDPQTGKIVGRHTVETRTPQARLEAFARLNRDLHAYNMLEMLREFGLVKSEAEITALAANRGGKAGLAGFGPIVEEFVQLPNDKQKLGNMAGQFVHPRVLTEMNNMTHTYDQLRAWFDGLQELWNKEGTSRIDEVLNNGFRSFGNVVQRVGRVVKTTQILMNQASYAANVIFNVTLSYFTSGSGVFSPKNFHIMLQAAKDVFGGMAEDAGLFAAKITRNPKTRDWVLSKNLPGQRSQFMEEAIQNGIINGALFERNRNPRLRRVFLNLAQMMEAGPLRDRLDTLQRLLDAKVQRAEAGQATRDIELEIVAIEEALNQLQRPFIQKIFEKVMGVFGAVHDNKLGMPASKTNEMFRAAYSKIDDFFKLLNYTYLRQTGLAPEQAAWHVKSFMQDYENLPAAVQWSQRSPFGALVPSFAYELMRIGTNLMRYKPHRAVSTFGAVAAFNQFNAIQAGISEERIDAMEQASGNRSLLDQMIAKGTRLYWYDPYRKERILDIDLSDTLLPLANFTDSYSAFGRLADSLYDRDDRTGMQSAAALALKVAGNFVGGQPVMSWAAALTSGRDPVTGKLILDKDLSERTTWDHARAFHKIVGQGLIPPALPGGRQWTEVAEGLERPLNPSTGRPYGGRSAGTALINALTNIKVRGWPAQVVSEFTAKILGGEGKDKPVAVDDRDIIQMIVYQADRSSSADPNGVWSEMSMIGRNAERRMLWARMMGESDPAQREALRQELKLSLKKQDDVRVAGRKATETMDEYRQFTAMKALEERGVANHFDALPVFRQVVALTAMDAAGVRKESIREYEHLVITSQTREKLKVEIERNPFAVQSALDYLKDYTAARPSKGYNFQNVEMWLRWVYGKAYQLGTKEMAIYEAQRTSSQPVTP